MKHFRTIAIAAALALGGCHAVTGPNGQVTYQPGLGQQSASLPADVIAALGTQITQGKLFVTDLQDADWDAHQAVTVGALSTADPMPACLDGLMLELGVTGSPPPSYVPRVSGLISAGVQAYIRAQQLAQLQGGAINVPPSCDAVLGKMMRQILVQVTRIGITGLGASVGLPLH